VGMDGTEAASSSTAGREARAMNAGVEGRRAEPGVEGWSAEAARVPAGLSAERAWRWCVLQTWRDMTRAARGGRPISLPNAERLFCRRWWRVAAAGTAGAAGPLAMPGPPAATGSVAAAGTAEATGSVAAAGTAAKVGSVEGAGSAAEASGFGSDPATPRQWCEAGRAALRALWADASGSGLRKA
jgi:hypothetical protein